MSASISAERMINKARKMASTLLQPQRSGGNRINGGGNHDLNPTSHKDQGWTIDDFHIGPAIGRGRFGNVYAAQEKESRVVRCGTIVVLMPLSLSLPSSSPIHRPRSMAKQGVAIKIIFKEKLECHNGAGLSQLKHEFEVHSQLDHPRIIRLYGAFEDAHRGRQMMIV